MTSKQSENPEHRGRNAPEPEHRPATQGGANESGGMGGEYPETGFPPQPGIGGNYPKQQARNGGEGGEHPERDTPDQGGMGGEYPERSSVPLTSGDPQRGKVGVLKQPEGTAPNVPPPMTHDGAPD